MVVNS